jgi:hypothetical protein
MSLLWLVVSGRYTLLCTHALMIAGHRKSAMGATGLHTLGHLLLNNGEWAPFGRRWASDGVVRVSL